MPRHRTPPYSLSSLPRSAAARVALALAVLACATLAGTAAAALYKWTDANGRVVYSDQPPMGNVKWETLQGAAPPSNPNAVKEMAAKEVDLKKRQTELVDNAKKADAQRAEAVKRAEACSRAKNDIKALSADQIALVRYNDKGEIIYVDEETRRKERSEREIWIKANCPAA